MKQNKDIIDGIALQDATRAFEAVAAAARDMAASCREANEAMRWAAKAFNQVKVGRCVYVFHVSGKVWLPFCPVCHSALKDNEMKEECCRDAMVNCALNRVLGKAP